MNLINNLKSLLTQTKFNVYESQQIKQSVPYLSDWADIVLETDTHFICFKDIWTLNNLTSKMLNSYLYGLTQLNSIVNLNSNTTCGKIYVFVLLVKNSNLNFDNKILNQKNIHIIKKYNQNKLMKVISYFLYSLNIYFYDPDDSIIMLE